MFALPVQRAALRRRVVGAMVLSVLVGLAVACGAFSLNSVVEGGAPDASSIDGSVGREGGGSGETGSGPDSQAEAAPDAGPCDAAADACACLPVTTLAEGVQNVGALTIDGSDLYWVANGGGKFEIFRLPVGASVGSPSPARISDAFALANGKIDGLPFYAKNFYLAVQDSHYFVATVLIDSDGGGKVVELTSHFEAIPTDVLVGAKGIYWTDNTSEICYARLDGGVATKGDSGCGAEPLAVAADGGGPANNALALTDTSVYQSVYKTGAIRVVSNEPPSVGTPKIILQRDVNETRILLATGTDLFFSESMATSGAIFHANLSGMGVSQLVGDAGPIGSIVVDGVNIYYAVDPSDSQTTAIYYAPRGGGPSTLLACDPEPEYLVEDATYVYWWSAFNNEVRRVPKP
jgi:hypothetical protein